MYFLLSLQQAGMNKFRWLCACPQWTAFASDWMTTRQFAVCLSGDWTPSCCSCWPSTPQEGVHGGERHSVAQGTWRNRSWCCSSVSQSCPTLCDPLDCSTPGFPVHHQLPEFAQTQAHRVRDGPGNLCSMSRRVDCLRKLPIWVSSPSRKIYLFSPIWIYLITYLCSQNGYLFYTLGYNPTFLYLFCCRKNKVSITSPKTPLHVA